MRKLFLVIPVSAVLIAGLIVYRLNRPPPVPAATAIASAVRPAPLFQLYDENSQIVRLAERYIGRHKLLIVFFDGSKGVDANELIKDLSRDVDFRAIAETKAVVLAISALRPSELRPANNEQGERVRREQPIPFPLLADIHDYEVHRLYGAWDDDTGEPREAVFVIDRTGIIRHGHVGPDGLGTPGQWADELRRVR
ncbi:MAG: redoxin domain-containing protein [Planctomycetaceae bacterium]|nr:redoxin domain-containing protein [Planctomycetaceae bacterium]